MRRMSQEQGENTLFILVFCMYFYTDLYKRRCIHDEHGRIDPVKAQERSKPRATSSAKRPRTSEDGIDPVTSKKAKPETVAVVSSSAADQTGFEGEEPTAPYYPISEGHLANEEQEQYHKLANEGLTTVQSPPEERPNISYDFSPGAKMNGDAAMIGSMPAQANNHLANPLVSPPTSLAGEAEVLPPKHPNDELHGGSATVDGEHEVLHTPTSSSRHSSRQPRQVDRYVPEQHTAKPATSATASRQTKPASTKKSASSRPSSSHSKKGLSPSVEKKSASSTAAAATSPSSSHQSHHRHDASKGVKRERTSFTADDADAESLRLIREIQEQEFGLRRRATRV